MRQRRPLLSRTWPVLSMLLAGALVLGFAPALAAAQEEQSAVNVVKTNDLGGAPLTPGKEFRYELTVQCSGLRVDCVNETFTDTLPVGLDVTSLPQSTGTRTVTYDETTRLLTIVFKEALQEPPDTLGLPAGSTRNLEVGMRLPAGTPLLDGTVITNTARVVADNADPITDSNDVVVSVPRKVTPVATKGWTDGSAVAGSGEDSTIRLGVRNASSSSAEVTSLTVTDDDPDTFDAFDLQSATLLTFPAGADRAQLLVKTTDGFVAGGTVSGPGALPLPTGVDPGDVTGVRVVFTAANGDPLPYDATGGTVDLAMTLRDTHRSDGSPLRPTSKLTVDNCAVPSAQDAVQGSVTGAAACKTYDILPDTLDLRPTKTFFPDTDGDFTQEAGEYAVLGQNSPVSAKVDVKNASSFPIAEISIVEPDAAAPQSEFGKFDTDKVRLRFPSGATGASLKVTYADGTTFSNDYTAGTTITVAKAGTRVTKVEVTYTGKTADGSPTIGAGATAGLDLAGTLNDSVTAADLPGGSSPGVGDCAAYAGSAGRTDGTGTASGTACATLAIQEPSSTSQGVKSVGQTSVPPGQPIPFTLKVTNNGNLPLVAPVISDPRTGPDGKPDPNFPNPFDSLQITSASVTKSPGTPPVTIEIYDPTVGSGTWVAYSGASAEVLARVTGVRARMEGSLAPTKNFTLNLVTTRRAGVANAVSILNCFSTTAGGDYVPGDPACAPAIQTGPANDSALLNKSISPGTLPEYVPGLPRQHADVALTVRNNGNLSMKEIQVVDQDADFFDGVDFVTFRPVKFPAGANRVQVDALVNGAWVLGTPATGAALPTGVSPADVTGIRATFTSTDTTTNDGYVITPCDSTGCQGALTLQISPRPSLRSDPGEPVPSPLEDTAAGSFETNLQPPGQPKPIPPVDATLRLVSGSPELTVVKTPNTAISPGEPAPFNLKVTNTGTSNIPDLVVKDRLPAGLTFDESFVGDGGQPFKVVGVQVPTGTPQPPAPTFSTTATGERISGLEWDFGQNPDGSAWLFPPGATLTVQIQVLLAPGASAGDEFINTMGASSSAPDLACAGTSEVNGLFGDGTYCTDTAAVTAKAGAAFQARKWVAGNPDLGWYDTRTKKPVPVGSRLCPSATDATSRVYTAYPCVALVNPGDQYKYLLRLVNAGTEPATDMRIIDRFPVQGDKGVILPGNRGTQWDNRPTLASPPALDGPGTLTTTYTDTEPICTKDLDMGGAGSMAPQCAPGDWAAPFSPAAVAAQMQLGFEPSLLPGGSVDITFAMDTPLEVAQVSNPTIAWNSYAHAETTLRGSGSHVLPKTEPIQVGVATAYGSLRLVKAIGENPSNLPLQDVTFPFQVRCVIDPIGRDPLVVLNQSYDVSADAPVTIPGLPAGADCTVWETDDRGGVTNHPAANPVEVAIDASLGDEVAVETATITNDFPDAVLQLDKEVTGLAANYAKDSYPVDVFCSFQDVPLADYDPKQVELRPADKRFVTNVPAGADCYVAETDAGGATEVTYDPPGPDPAQSGTVRAQAGEPQTLTITNEFRAGGLAISKELTGPGAPELSNGPFTFAVACDFDGRPDVFTDTVTLTGDGTGDTLTSDPITGLPVGAECTVTETDNGGADATPEPVTVPIPDELDGQPQVVTAGFSNVFSAATLSLTKVLDGAGAEAAYAQDATFTVLVRCQREDGAGNITDVFNREVSLKGGETVFMTDAQEHPVKLPVGSHCFGEETASGGATSHEVDYDSYDNAAIVQESPELEPLQITATNTFDVSALDLSKVVDGAAAGFVGDRQFTLAVTCDLPREGAEPFRLFTDEPYQVVGGQTMAIEDLPVGAHCWASEPDSGGAARTEIDHGTPDDPAVVAADATGSIVATNTFDPGTLVVAKQVVNGGPGPYSFTVACTTDQGDVTLPPAQASFRLAAGKQHTQQVPLGATCSVREVHAPAGDTVTYSDSGGGNHGTVVVNSNARVQVTNTFAKKPPPAKPAAPVQPPANQGPGGPATAQLPHTGGPGALWPLAGLLAIALGAALLWASRRRA